MELLRRVKERLGIVCCENDNVIQGYIDDVSSKIKSVCNRKNIPEELEYLIIKYAMNCTVFYERGYGESKQVVSTVSDNGQSVTYKDIDSITADDVDLDKYVEKNKDEISMYAYMRW